ncbi:hypothetical protein DU19_0804 [Chlamydia muridarum]|nr:hypothetical protein DU17_0806 [Chlamydia muridarum]KDU81752.1 hypothetical protein DU18_0804 [Chlamydia muridarum]KDU82350.1 hypothetical protein DU19_0804 [Chlamydia muridarum]KDU83707.1 hypothetical protein DU20_0804 [Chlamydia muridarum]KDU84687.1 hypothetical protein DU21_0806 [Chlamydia muridarum]
MFCSDRKVLTELISKRQKNGGDSGLLLLSLRGFSFSKPYVSKSLELLSRCFIVGLSSCIRKIHE